MTDKVALLVPLPLLVMVLTVACGTASYENNERYEQFSKITETEIIFTPEDFLSIGFKQSKDYDVTELPGATSAIYGFWKPDGGESTDYELRFYPSHDDAITKGTSFVDEVTGSNAAVANKDVTWREGTRDRRIRSYFSNGGVGRLVSKYADYIINSNVIILCQGLDKDQSLDRCRAIINAVIEKTE